MDALRRLPPVNDILAAGTLHSFQPLFGQPFFKRIVERTIRDVRAELVAGLMPEATRDDLTQAIAAAVAKHATAALKPSLRRVINGSGVILHTNLGRAPLPPSVFDYVRNIGTHYSNLEYDVDRGERGKRDTHAERLLCNLLNVEAAIVVNNNAAAVLLVLNTFGEGGEVIASRGEQIEIGGSFRIPEVMTKSGARLHEVGTTNRTRLADYEAAINENTRLLLRVHPSNFRIIGFTERPALEEFVALGRKRNIPTFEDLGSGCLIPLESVGIAGEPVVTDSVRAGVDVICFSGDKLLGGPQAGIIAGRKTHIDRIRSNPLFRALRVDKLTLSALEPVLLMYLQGIPGEIPVVAMLAISEDELRKRAEEFARLLPESMEPVRMNSLAGGGSAPEAPLVSWGIALKLQDMSEAEVEKRLRRSEPPVIARIEAGRVVLDFRTIFPGEEMELFEILKALQP